MNQVKKNIAIFASGSGTNALNICNYFADSTSVKVTTLVCNKPNAKVIDRLQPFEVEVILIRKVDFEQPEKLIQKLIESKIELIVLAGFLWLIPNQLIKIFKDKIVNLHPSLLPKYGGKGMYGLKVHKAVLAANEKETGISIHFVNAVYDEGKIIFQVSLKIDEDESAEGLAKKIHQLEYQHYPKIIEQVLANYKSYH